MASKKQKRKQRLQKAKKFISTYEGKNIVRGYCRKFNVGQVCAIKELEILGYEIDSDYKKQAFSQHNARIKTDEKKRKEKETKKTELEPWQDENFYYIAGYTSGGVPFGITWEEYERDIKEDNDKQDEVKKNIEEKKNDSQDFLDWDIPF